MNMDIKEIQDLIAFVAKSGVNEVALEEKDFKITIKANSEPTYVTTTVPAAPPAQLAPAVSASVPSVAVEASAEIDESKYIIVKSPMIGTFYRSPGPDKPAFINVGDDIGPGKVLCIVEAMKLFNEIEAEVSGRIVKILVSDAQPVEFDQPLFLVDPS